MACIQHAFDEPVHLRHSDMHFLDCRKTDCSFGQQSCKRTDNGRFDKPCHILHPADDGHDDGFVCVHHDSYFKGFNTANCRSFEYGKHSDQSEESDYGAFRRFDSLRKRDFQVFRKFRRAGFEECQYRYSAGNDGRNSRRHRIFKIDFCANDSKVLRRKCRACVCRRA